MKLKTATGVGNDDADCSWWPKHSTWEATGVSANYWATDCEDWYQKRKSSFTSGKFEVHSAAAWRAKLKYQPDTQKMRHNVETASVKAMKQIGLAMERTTITSRPIANEAQWEIVDETKST